jgi:hypothetical protein
MVDLFIKVGLGQLIHQSQGQLGVLKHVVEGEVLDLVFSRMDVIVRV